MKLAWLLIFLAGLNSTLGNIFLKRSQLNADSFNSFFSLDFILGCTFYFVNVIFFAIALRTIEVTKAYPSLAGVAFITLAIAGYLHFGERLSTINYLGIILILSGISLVVYK